MLEHWIAAWKQRHAARIAAWQAGGRGYVGRYAPSPTGPLHAGSLVAALASYLDARAHEGRWLLRIRGPRPAARGGPARPRQSRRTLAACGLAWDGEIMLQSRRGDAYQAAYDRLAARDCIYPCSCTRKEVADSVANLRQREFGRELVYPGTCRGGLAAGRAPRAWRMAVGDAVIAFDDVFRGPQRQELAREAGDFVLRRADGLWAYQLAVVVDDHCQGVTHVVRGADLLDSTARQILLQNGLGYAAPEYAHVDVLTDAAGEKLSKQTGAPALTPGNADAMLRQAAQFLFDRHG